MAGVIAAWLAAPINDGGFDDLDKDQKPRYRDKVCLPQIWVECLRGDLRSYTAANQQAIARAMSKAAIASSWQQASPVVHGAYGRQRTYVRVTPLEEADLIG
jgi:hypothetical protein